MTSEPIQMRYLAANQDATTKLSAFVQMQHSMDSVLQALKEDPTHFTFENCSVGITHRYPAKYLFNARSWPSADQIQTALNNWLTAQEQAHQIWEMMRPHEQQGLTPPVGWKRAAA